MLWVQVMSRTATDVTTPEAYQRRRWVRSAAFAAGSCAVGGSVGYAVGGLALVMAGLVTVVVAGGAVAVIVLAMLGCRDRRSPFERLILLICVITGRKPLDYLPPTATQKRRRQGR